MKRTGQLILFVVMAALVLAGCQPGQSASSANELVSESASEPVSQQQEPLPESSEQAETEEAAPALNTEWQFNTPEDHGMNSELLTSMHTALESTDIRSVVTVKDGVIIDEYYKEDYDETSIFPVHSVSKSFTSALIGIAMEDGLIDSLDSPISTFLPQINDMENTRFQEVTLRQVLTHTSGMEWYEWNGNVTTFFDWRDSDDWVDYILNQPFVAEPGSTFNYTTGGTHLLAAILYETSGKSVTEYATEHIFGPLGMDSVEWGEDPQGIADGGNGLLMNARDMAKFGQLYLNGGSWDGQQLVPEQWVKDSTAVQFERWGDSGSYGYQWWVRPYSGYDAYYAMGAWGQFIYVVPELNLVTTITSNHPENTYLPVSYFTDYILAACQ